LERALANVEQKATKALGFLEFPAPRYALQQRLALVQRRRTISPLKSLTRSAHDYPILP